MVLVLAVVEQMSTILFVNCLGALLSATPYQIPIRRDSRGRANE